jgi:hypothetical protein
MAGLDRVATPYDHRGVISTLTVGAR